MNRTSQALIIITILSCITALASLEKADAGLSSPAANVRGKVALQKYPGNSTCFLIQSSAGINLVTDPFAMDKPVHAAIVTESHNHIDHSDVAKLLPPYKLITTCGEFHESGVKITGIPGHHNRGDQAVTNIIFVFDIAGIRIAQFASQGDMLEQAALRRIGTVDVLIIQFFDGGADKLTLAEACATAHSLAAKIVIPAHGDNSSATINRFAHLLSNTDFIPVKSGKITLSRVELDQIKIPKVLVLDR